MINELSYKPYRDFTKTANFFRSCSLWKPVFLCLVIILKPFLTRTYIMFLGHANPVWIQESSTSYIIELQDGGKFVLQIVRKLFYLWKYLLSLWDQNEDSFLCIF